MLGNNKGIINLRFMHELNWMKTMWDQARFLVWYNGLCSNKNKQTNKRFMSRFVLSLLWSVQCTMYDLLAIFDCYHFWDIEDSFHFSISSWNRQNCRSGLLEEKTAQHFTHWLWSVSTYSCGSAMGSVHQCTVCSVQFIVCSVQCTVFIVKFTVFIQGNAVYRLALSTQVFHF